MFHNLVGGSSSTGGASTLTLAPVRGMRLPSSVMVDGQSVAYTIAEYADSTLTTVSKFEAGVGKIASNVLTRTRVDESWDGTTEDQDGTVSKLSFGTSNVVVRITLSALHGHNSFPMRANFAGAYIYGPNEWIIGSNFLDAGDFAGAALPANSLVIVPLHIKAGFVLTSLGVNISTAASGKSISVCIAGPDIANNGVPAVALAVVNGLSAAATGIVSGSIGAPRIIVPGDYYALMTSDGSPNVLGSVSMAPSMIGGLASTSRIVRYVTQSKTYAGFTAGSSVMGTAGTASVNNTAAPCLLMR